MYTWQTCESASVKLPTIPPETKAPSWPYLKYIVSGGTTHSPGTMFTSEVFTMHTSHLLLWSSTVLGTRNIIVAEILRVYIETLWIGSQTLSRINS